MKLSRRIGSHPIDHRAFTLLEVLVAMAVLAVLLTILLSMVNGASALWRSSEQRVDSFREGRAALNLLTSDLTGIYASNDPNYFAVATTDPEIKRLVTTPAGSKVGDALFFVTSLPEDSQDPTGNKSDLCAVGYFVAFGKSSGNIAAKNSYNLYRYFISSDDTFDNIQKGQTTPFFKGDDAKVSATTKEVEIVARNITKFDIQAYTLVKTPNGDFGDLVEFDQSSLTPMPNVLDITLVAVNQDTADGWQGAKNLWEDTSSATYKNNARTFKTRIYIPRTTVATATLNQ